MGKFIELAHIIGYFTILAANVLRSIIGRARYHEGMPLKYFAKGDHFPVDARGRGVDPNDMCSPLDSLPFPCHVLCVDLEEFNSANATNLADHKMNLCLAMSRGIRVLTAADGLVVDLTLEEMCWPDEIKPCQIVENERFDVDKLGPTHR
jgi:hypothetical protein